MDLLCQKEAITLLEEFKDSNIHSILIAGPEGVGKTYLAKQYCNMMDIRDFFIVEPKANEIREMVQGVSDSDYNIVICVENIDTGVFGAVSALLKFLEEPTPNVYMIVTARNINNVPDTIISRCHIAELSAPNKADIVNYAKHKYLESYNLYKDMTLWNCVKTFNDVDVYMDLDMTYISYIESIPDACRKVNCVSDLMWTIQKYPDNKETPVNLVIRYIIYKYPQLIYAGIECIKDLQQSRMASHAVIAKFGFEVLNMKR